MSDKKICYVIMPFSKTESTPEDEWLKIYNNLFKPIIEDPKFGYVCKKSELENGSFTKEIVMQLKSADLVLADLTDFNHNVMWELGVRHALSKRTIMIARKEMIKKIPSDIKNYGVVSYTNSITNYQEFKEKIHELLEKVLKNPERPDNPVYDFLKESDLILSNYNKTRAISLVQSLLSETGENIFVIDQLIEKIKKNELVGFYQLTMDSLKYLLSSYAITDGDLIAKGILLRALMQAINVILNEVRDEKYKLKIEKEKVTNIKKELIDFKDYLLQLKTSIESGSFVEKIPPIVLIGDEYDEMFDIKH